MFSTIWIATVVSSIGGWMSSAASAWLMTGLEPDPIMVALVQAASTFPMFLFAIPAGALADIINKRIFLLVGELSITVTATVFVTIVWFDVATPVNLLLFTVLSSTAVAFTWPAWLSVVPDLVPKRSGDRQQYRDRLALVLFRVAGDWVLATVASVLAGGSWIGAVASLNVSAQVALPGWVRGREIAIYVSVFYGAITVGSALWGTVADALGFTITHFVAAAGMLAGIPANSRWRLHTGKQLDLTPSMHWPAPILDRSLRESHGRVLVMVEYRINAQDRTPFLAAIEDLGQERRRDGTYA